MDYDWRNIHYLRDGGFKQQLAFIALHGSGVWKLLDEFKPVLAGTIPLGINIPGSDLDVLCEVPEAAQGRFAALVQAHFGAHQGFRLAQRSIGGYATTVAGFHYRDETIELFGQALPTDQQLGWRHLLVERAVLEVGGQAWRMAVRYLKLQGLKTEPAFAQLLGLAGDPYTALLALEDWPADTLRERVAAIVLPELG